MLPHALAFNRRAAPEAMKRVARALGAADAARGVYELMRRFGAPLALRDLGLKETDLDGAAELASQSPYANPRLVERAGVRALLDDAYHGRLPVV